jgi:hypothetical protein
MQSGKQEEISIQAAYAQMTDPSRADTFSLVIRLSGGKEIGQKRTLYRCRFGKRAGSGKTREQRAEDRKVAGLDKSGLNGTERRQHVENGTIPIHDLEQNRYISPLISHITEFNQYKVIH